MSHAWFAVLIAAVGIERLAELVVSRRNGAWSLAHGGQEVGSSHYPVMVALHSSLLIGALVESFYRPFLPALGWPMLVLTGLAQCLRWWCITTLGRRWNTKIIVIPGLPLVAGGPYKVLRHPNYVAVVVEGFALPLIHTAWTTALVFTLANAVLMRVRIGAENVALAQAVGV